jgi:CheY-like chemotaxis protein
VNRRAEEVGSDRARRRPTAAPPSSPTTILVVDDHPPNLTALEAILQPLGPRVICASSGAQAVEIAAQTDLALVLLDLQMPELDGLETAALLKKNERYRAVPIIILTADPPTRAEVAQG